MGKQIRDTKGRFSSLWIKIKNFFRVMFRIGMLAGLVYVAFIAGRYIQPDEQIINVVQADNGIPPVLQRIAKCESGDKHFDTNGQVLMRSNTNRSVDLGRYQINTVWFAKATELGLDLTLEKDNEKMARWIYENRGTGDWSSSSKCWKQ